MKINAYNPQYSLDLSGAVSVAASTTGISLGSNTPLAESGGGSVGSGPQAAPWDHVHPASGGAAAAFGSNSTRVSSVSAAGASSSNSRADHVHDGIATITASSSNSLNRGTVNLRPGTGIALALSNIDGGSGFDTVTITNIASSGGGGGGGGGGTDLDVSPNPTSDDHEFRSSLSGWTTLGSPDVADANATGYDSLLRLSVASPGTFQVHGIYRAIPSGGLPFTVTMRMPDYRNDAVFQTHGFLLTESSPGKLFMWSPLYQNSNGIPELFACNWTNRTTRSTYTEYGGTRILAPKYLKMEVDSNTSVDLWWSHNGQVWIEQATGWNPNMTIANIGIAVSGQDQNPQLSCVVDWIRFGTGQVIQAEALLWQGA